MSVNEQRARIGAWKFGREEWTAQWCFVGSTKKLEDMNPDAFRSKCRITLVMDVYAKLSVQTYKNDVALGFTSISLGNFCNKIQAWQQRRTMIHWLPFCLWAKLGICMFTSTETSWCLTSVWVTGKQIPCMQKQQVFTERSFAWHGIPETVITDNVTQFSCQGSAICSTSRTGVCHIPATLQPKQKQLSGLPSILR